MNGQIIFNIETSKAMMALIRFMEYEFKGNKYNHQEVILAFKQYIEDNKLESPIIVQCDCKLDISNREMIFNVCLHCKGVVSKDFLTGFPGPGFKLTAV